MQAGKVLILGGTGQIGRAAAPRLADAGWSVALASRSRPPADMAVYEWRQLDRDDEAALQSAARGVDVLVDIVAYSARHAAQLVSLSGIVGSLVVISTAAVYSERQPWLPVREDAPTVAPGDDDYAGRKRALELALLAHPELRATLLRAGAIHGAWSPHPREWYFVKRVLDQRRAIVLANRGARILHPVSTRNLAELIAAAASRPGARVLNAGDPEPPNALQISRVIAELLDHAWAEVLMPGDAEGTVGDSPWNGAYSLVMDMNEAAAEIHYQPAVSFRDGVAGEVEWLLQSTRQRDWHTVIRDHAYLEPLFDYAAEDVYLQRLAGTRTMHA